MKVFLFVPLLVFLGNLSGCTCLDDPINMDQVSKLVTLSPEDLQNFERLSDALVQDLPKLRKQYESVTTPGNRTKWMSTNSYYLDLIDSTKYRALLSPLKGKHIDDYWITDSGGTIFYLKEFIQNKCDTYRDSYEHRLVKTATMRKSTDYGLENVEVVYVDSVINSNWKYQYFMNHSGW